MTQNESIEDDLRRSIERLSEVRRDAYADLLRRSASDARFTDLSDVLSELADVLDRNGVGGTGRIARAMCLIDPRRGQALARYAMHARDRSSAASLDESTAADFWNEVACLTLDRDATLKALTREVEKAISPSGEAVRVIDDGQDGWHVGPARHSDGLT